MPGKRVVILGSGDIGLIMARRMTLEGAKVLRVCELMCLFRRTREKHRAVPGTRLDIPLYLSHTVTEIRGKERVEGVTISEDRRREPPPNPRHRGIHRVRHAPPVGQSNPGERAREIRRDKARPRDRRRRGRREQRDRAIPGVFACGNALHVHDLVDFVTREAYNAGKSAAKRLRERRRNPDRLHNLPRRRRRQIHRPSESRPL